MNQGTANELFSLKKELVSLEYEILELEAELGELERDEYDTAAIEQTTTDIQRKRTLLKRRKGEYKMIVKRVPLKIRQELNTILKENKFEEEIEEPKRKIVPFPKLTRQISEIVTNQEETDTCWNFSSSRCIVRYYRKAFPELLGIDSVNDCHEFYDYATLYDIFDCKTEGELPCSQSNYNRSLLYTFIYAIFNEKYGNNSNTVNQAFVWFFNHFLTTDLPRLLNGPPAIIKARIIKKVIKEIAFELTPEYYSLGQLVKILRRVNENRKETAFYLHMTDYPRQELDRTDFTCVIKKFVDSGYYGVISVPSNPDYNHAMTVVGYEETFDFYVLVKNSWGTIGGSILDQLHYTSSDYDPVRNLLRLSFEDLNRRQTHGRPINIFYFEIEEDYQNIKTKYMADLFSNVGNEIVLSRLLKQNIIMPDKLNHIINGNGFTLLSEAVETGRLPIMKLLLEKGLNPNQVDAGLLPPLYTSVRKSESISRLLIEYGADVNKLVYESGLTPLLGVLLGFCQKGNRHYETCKKENSRIVELLLSNGADMNVKGPDGSTALHMACISNYTDIVRVLLDYGADINAQMNSGYTPLHFACENGREGIVCVLLEKKGIDVDKKDNEGDSALVVASSGQYTKIVSMLLSAGADPNGKNKSGIPFFHYSWKPEITKMLLDAGADVNSTTNEKLVLLHRSDDVKNMTIVATHPNADVNRQTSHGHTPLHIACKKGNLQLVRMFVLKAHAKVDIKNNKGETPLDVAKSMLVSGNGEHPAIVSFLTRFEEGRARKTRKVLVKKSKSKTERENVYTI